MLFALLLFILTMCLHHVLDRKLSELHNKYENVNLDKFDNCEYVHQITDVCQTDLVVIQLNIRGIGSKRSQLIDLIDTSVQSRHPDVLMLSETWLTLFSPRLIIPGYELFHKKGGGVPILVSNTKKTPRKTQNSAR